jgi:ABC-type transporter Mla MlaB component
MQQTDSSGGADKSAPARRHRAKVLRLGPDLGIEHAAGLKAQLGRLLEEPGKVALAGAEVERVHTAALQLFCLFCCDRRAAGREVEFQRPSPALRSAAALLGASTLLRIVAEPT